MNQFKRSQSKYVKKAYRVRNWSEYEAGLRDRGSLSVCTREIRKGEVVLFDWHRMGVDPEREFRVAVAELLRDPADRSTCVKRQTGEGVACAPPTMSPTPAQRYACEVSTFAEPEVPAGIRPARCFAVALSSALALCMGSMAGVATASGEGDVQLPQPSRNGEVAVERALALRRSVRAFASEPLPLAAVAQLLWAAQGITHPDGLRTAPSAGALYPLEVYLVAGAVSGLTPGVYRYDPRRHRLTLRSEGDARTGVAEAALDQDWVAEAPAIVVLAAVYERTTRKYGKRSERYVYMELGHAAQNVYLQAAALGLGTTMVGAFRDEQLARVLRLPKHTEPVGLLPVGTPRR